MKHGPIALIDPKTPTVFLVPQDSMYDKTMANLAMIRARKGPIIALATEGDKQIGKVADDVIYLPEGAGTDLSDPGHRAAAIVRLSHRRRARLRRGQAAQPGQERDGGITGILHQLAARISHGADMNKRALIKKIVARLTDELEVYFRAAQASRAEATHEQSKAENKYDTRGLEASYLARGQSKQAAEIQEAIAAFEKLDARKFGAGEPIDVGAFVELELNGETDGLLHRPTGGRHGGAARQAGSIGDYTAIAVGRTAPGPEAGRCPEIKTRQCAKPMPGDGGCLTKQFVRFPVRRVL